MPPLRFGSILLLLLTLGAGCARGRAGEALPMEDDVTTKRALTPEEERVIVGKGTEAPFSGKYWRHSKVGTYNCRRCGARLFASSAKFDAGCGWPSFDEALAGAVSRLPDADGVRTEIVCSRCGAHLGHVFAGERFTAKDTRHCVNSVSLEFEPAAPVSGAEPCDNNECPPRPRTGER